MAGRRKNYRGADGRECYAWWWPLWTLVERRPGGATEPELRNIMAAHQIVKRDKPNPRAAVTRLRKMGLPIAEWPASDATMPLTYFIPSTADILARVKTGKIRAMIARATDSQRLFEAMARWAERFEEEEKERRRAA